MCVDDLKNSVHKMNNYSLVSTVNWIAHLLIVNRLQFLAKRSPTHEINLIDMPDASKIY